MEKKQDFLIARARLPINALIIINDFFPCIDSALSWVISHSQTMNMQNSAAAEENLCMSLHCVVNESVAVLLARIVFFIQASMEKVTCTVIEYKTSSYLEIRNAEQQRGEKKPTEGRMSVCSSTPGGQ